MEKSGQASPDAIVLANKDHDQRFLVPEKRVREKASGLSQLILGIHRQARGPVFKDLREYLRTAYYEASGLASYKMPTAEEAEYLHFLAAAIADVAALPATDAQALKSLTHQSSKRLTEGAENAEKVPAD